jgi:hypothetical protein
VDGTEITMAAIGKVLIAAGGGQRERAFFRQTRLDRRPTSQRARLLTIGIVLRNALVDQGFVVFSPLTNIHHKDHVHFHAHDLLGAPNQPTNWESAISSDLARARGEISNR